MPKTTSSSLFRNAVLEEIWSWQVPGLKLYKEAFVGLRFIGVRRYIDIVLQHGARTLGLECKVQESGGTADQKLLYALEDVQHAPIPVIIVFTGEAITQDLKARLILSGKGIEVEWDPAAGRLTQNADLLQQRVFMELGLDWLALQPEKEYLGPGAPAPAGPRTRRKGQGQGGGPEGCA